VFKRIPGSRMYEMRTSRPVVTDRIDMSSDWHCGGYKKGTEDFFDNNGNGFGLSLSPLTKWHHLKLKVIKHYWLYDYTVGSDYLTHRDGLLAHANPMVEDVVSDSGQLYGRRVKVTAPEPTLHSLILKSLVWEIGFHGSPEDTARVFADIGERMHECDDDQALRDSLLGDDGVIDPTALARSEAEIEAELAAEEAREAAEHKANPFDEKDVKTLEIARAVMAKTPDSIRAPEGLPDVPNTASAVDG
jgi:hypothetical protein